MVDWGKCSNFVGGKEKNNTMNRIILVGNGFDLAHGLKTKYEDFINWYFEQLKKTLAYCNYTNSEDGLCKLHVDVAKIGAISWRDFLRPHIHNIFKMSVDEFLNYIDYHRKQGNIKVEFSSLLKRISKAISIKGWVDIEADYYELLKDCPDLNENVVADLQQSLKYLQGKLAEYLLCVQDSATDNINVAISEIINEPILGRDISQYALKHIINSEEDRIYPLEESLILDFNYTHTTDLYHNNVIHIHGKLDSPKSIIFGYGDDLDEYYKKLSNLNDNRYLTNIKSIRYLESGNYRDMLRFINAAPYQIYIMGHSCGNSDRTLLNTLFEHENCVSIKPFYYQKDEENDNYSEITQNISRNFTDMQSFRDKVVNKTLCVPMPQLQI
mgnify:CR=1 FL=1